MKSCAASANLPKDGTLLQFSGPSDRPLCPIAQVSAHLGSGRQGPAEYRRRPRYHDQHFRFFTLQRHEPFPFHPSRSGDPFRLSSYPQGVDPYRGQAGSTCV